MHRSALAGSISGSLLSLTLFLAPAARGSGPVLPGSGAAPLLVRLSPGHELPRDLRAGARRLFGGWWRLAGGAAGAPGRSERELEALSRSAGVELVEIDRSYRLEIPEAADPVAPRANGSRTASLVADDPLFPQQWHHRLVQAEAAWLRSTGEGVVVAVIDSGVTAGGPDGFCHPFAGEYDAVNDESGAGQASDLLGHGTFVAKVIAECTANGAGAAGLAPGARLLAIRACTLDGECASSDIAAAIDWATTHGAKVINLSLGMACGDADWPDCSTAIENDALARAAAAGVTVVAIAGNGGEDHVGFPANHPDVLGVGGLDGRLLKTTYSSWGSALAVTAPAGEPGTDFDGDGFEDQILQETLQRVCGAGSGFAYCRWSGTSFAGPHVAAAAALLYEEHPDASPAEIRRALEESALDRGAPGFDELYGHGALQAAAALARLDEIVAASGSCLDSPTRLCLGEGGRRFAVEVGWRNYSGQTGTGFSHPLTEDSGLFWFFAPANLEMLVKVVDGCAFNGFFWVYAAATTDVAYDLTVTDTTSGGFRRFTNELGTASPAFTDSTAFPCAGPP